MTSTIAQSVFPCCEFGRFLVVIVSRAEEVENFEPAHSDEWPGEPSAAGVVVRERPRSPQCSRAAS